LQVTAYNIDPQTVGQTSAGAETDPRDLVRNPDATGDQVSIIGVKIYDAAGTLMEYRTNVSGVAVLQDSGDAGTGVTDAEDNSHVGITFVLDDSGDTGTADDIYSASINNLKANYTVEWITNGVHDAALVEHRSGSYDIGGFNLLQAQPTPDQLLEFTAQVIDGDGDTSTDSWSVGIDGTGIHDDGAVSGAVPPAALQVEMAAMDMQMVQPADTRLAEDNYRYCVLPSWKGSAGDPSGYWLM
jgi:hypothetical protein